MTITHPLTTITAVLCAHTAAAREPEHPGTGPIQGSVRIVLDGLICEDGREERYSDPDRALLHYAFDHYAAWRRRLPACAALLSGPGAFSENLSSLGITENTLCIGDVLKVGAATVQVTSGRIACSTMNGRFGSDRMAPTMHRLSRTGWFYRVLGEGDVRSGDALFLLERPNPRWSIARVGAAIYRGEMDPEALETLAGLKGMSSEWRQLFEQRGTTGALEGTY
ncbi:MOSC domain-containing protein [Phaeovibrio sulfidiphilus]|uniref:MOSC domain-containing protein n=1 Tax=Phaeovibrio sulfidiphilus TaxID=1220600 RepID=A0A8J7CDY0_9PROT|nr:MOSC domain-containing protein [Phaeovibrio sulfidiphilus]MBE1237369.1 MOSC domain-containing protein [Phaeovibrio sulfidiphilus]